MSASVLFLPRESMDSLFDTIRSHGYPRVVGPTVGDGAIIYREIVSASELPAGLHDRQAAGHYRLERQPDDPRAFSWANGPQALKPLTFSPRELLWRCDRDESGALAFRDVAKDAVPTAVIGIRACDLAALQIHERHFLKPPHADPHYAARRSSLFLVAVHCSHPADTCFCASTGDGPRVESGFDLAMAELDPGFVVSAGTDRGRTVLASMPLPLATAGQIEQVEAEIAAAGRAQTRSLPSRNLKEALYARLEHPHWDDVGRRCLSCGNCTAVCPTCFCHAEQDEPSLSGVSTEHLRQWDSCFTAVHSYMGHFLIREETRLRYRQWLTHKLASWHEQYGRSGCVGCGRCIAWCPVGIDITAEVPALLESGDAQS